MIDSLSHLPCPKAGHAELAQAFGDLEPPLTARQAALESERCLYCFDAPCVQACPTGIDIPGFIRRIGQGNLQGAAQTILEANILGGSCARVCPTEILCQQACVRNKAEECAPVLIGLLQRHALDNAGFDGHPFRRAPSSGRRVAVVGAGPAGLACAHRLALHGHDVVIFEARDKAGGLNEYGIARYKLSDDFARREVEFLLGIGGIELRRSRRLGDNLSLAELRRDFDSVFLGLGLAASRRLGLTGEDAPGLVPATEYIRELRQAEDLGQLPLARRCLVIGGGNTAIDMAVQISRLGAEEVTLVYRRGLAEMSATGHEQAIARAAGVRLLTWARPQEVLLDGAGRVRGMRFERTCLDSGRLVGSGETFELAAEAVFSAVGQFFDEPSLADARARELQRDGGRIRVDGQFRTSLPGVYAGGDCVSPGQDLTVQAVQHGKLAAEAIHADLSCKSEVA